MNTQWRRFGFVAITIFLVSAVCNAGEPFSMEVVGRWGGPVNDVEVVGNTAYIGSGSRLVALDVTNAANITEIGSVDLVVPVVDISVRGDFAYVTTVKESPPACLSALGFCVVDISNPANLQLTSFEVDAPGTRRLHQVHVHNDFAFVTYQGGVAIYNISDPFQVSWMHDVCCWLPSPFSVERSHIVGDFLYLASGGVGDALRIYNLQPDALNPTLVGEVAYPDLGDSTIHPFSLHVSNGVAAITGFATSIPDDQTKIVMFFDVSTPSQPSLLSVYNQFGPFRTQVTDVAIAGDYAFITSNVETGQAADPILWQQSKGLVVLDISNPSNPVEVADIKTHGTVRGVRIAGNRAYVMDDGEGMIVFDISNPANPQRLGNYHSPAHIRDMVKDGNFLYVADKWNGFTILDVSNPQETPEVVGIFQTPDLPAGQNIRIDHRSITVHNGYVYLMTGWFGLHVVDVSNPASPQIVDEVPAPSVVINGLLYQTVGRALAMTGDVVHATFELTGCSTCPPFWIFHNYDASDPTRISGLGNAILPGAGHWVAPKRMEISPDGIAFAARRGVAQFIDTGALNVPPYSNPSVLFDTTILECTGVDLKESMLFLTSPSAFEDRSGLHIQDVSNPLSPIPLSYLNADTAGLDLDLAWDVAVKNDRAYVFGQARPNASCPSSASSYVLAFDVSNPEIPVLLDHVVVASYPVGEECGTLLLDEPFLYAAGGRTVDNFLTQDGLSIIQINGIPAECPADINNSGAVDVFDLFVLLGNWSAAGAGADLAPPSNVVDVFDLFELLSAWGPCPTRAAHNMK